MMLSNRHLPMFAGAVALSAVLTACGGSSKPTSSSSATSGTRKIDVAMEDTKFDPATLTVNVGDTVKFEFTNKGKIAHDAFVGDQAAQDDHEAEMATPNGMDHMRGHSMDEGAITLQPGEHGALSYTFDQPGKYQVGCHQPGHYVAGMKIAVTVNK